MLGHYSKHCGTPQWPTWLKEVSTDDVASLIADKARDGDTYLMDHPDSTEEIPIPILDIAAGHGVRQDLVDRVFAESRRFHSLADEVKGGPPSVHRQLPEWLCAAGVTLEEAKVDKNGLTLYRRKSPLQVLAAVSRQP